MVPLTRALMEETSAYTAASSVDWTVRLATHEFQFAPAPTTAASATAIADSGAMNDAVDALFCKNRGGGEQARPRFPWRPATKR